MLMFVHSCKLQHMNYRIIPWRFDFNKSYSLSTIQVTKGNSHTCEQWEEAIGNAENYFLGVDIHLLIPYLLNSKLTAL